MFNSKNIIGIAYFIGAAIAVHFGHIDASILLLPIYGIWLTIHNVELKINALLDEKGLYVKTD